MAALDELIAQVQDDNLRGQLQAEFRKLRDEKTFGLVFESSAEFFPRADLPVKKNSLVAKVDDIDKTFRVTDIDGDKIFCARDKKTFEFSRQDLICVTRLGEAIYPGLTKLDEVCNAPDSSLWHMLIEAENYHALQLLKYPFAGKVDCIYIDPPYNTGARDWKYNDRYVEASNEYRHSKWLSMMERRLKLAKDLLADDGAIFISIDDNEACALKLLCDKVFGYKQFVAQIPWRKRTAKSDVPFGISQDFESVFCYANAKFVGGVKGKPRKYYETDDFPGRPWRIHDLTTQRTASERPNSFFTIVNPKTGEKFPAQVNRTWAITSETFPTYYAQDRIIFPGDYEFLKISRPVLRYWKADDMARAGDNFGIVAASTKLPETVGMTQDGTKELVQIFGDKRFSFPKPIRLVKHLINIATIRKPDALIVDFFAGSGTTLHAVNLLNAEDGGKRRCVLVTNNEGDIARSVTWPRTVCSVEGHDINGTPLKGNYLGTEREMSAGFATNAAFFALNCLDKNSVELGEQFNQTLPVLWLKAGGHGRCPTFEAKTLPPYKIFAENKFAVLFDESHFADFANEVDAAQVETLFAVTGSDEALNSLAKQLRVKRSFRLYEDYLENFKLEEAEP